MSLSIAQVRIFRLAFGTAASLGFSQLLGGDMSFIAAVFTLLLLGLPAPVLKPKAGLAFVLALSGSLYAGLLLLPTLLNQPMVGVLLLVLALFWSFYYTTKGGSALLGTFATIGIAVTTAVGSVNIDALLSLVSSLTIIATVGVVFVYIAHACIPDSLATTGNAPPAEPAIKPGPPDLAAARWAAFRSFLIVFPVTIWFLLSPSSAAYLAVMIKVASMGQQAAADATRTAGKTLLLSTIVGGVAAIIGWQLLRIVPTLTVFVLYVAIVGLVIGRKMFDGPAMRPNAAMWSYGLLTMLLILAPAVSDSAGGDAAGIKFWQRLVMFAGTAIYALVAVHVVDAFRPRKT